MPERIVERKPRPRDRVFIRLAGGRFFAVPEEMAAPMAVGVELSDEDIEQLVRFDQFQRGKEKALRMLALRARSRREVELALRGMEIPPPVVGGIIAELEDAGLLDDARFARDFVSVRKDVRRSGPHRLRADLRKLGVSTAVTEGALASFTPEDQESLARALATRLVGDGPVDERGLRKVMSALRRKGYDYAVVNRVAYDIARRSRIGEQVDFSGADDAPGDD